MYKSEWRNKMYDNSHKQPQLDLVTPFVYFSLFFFYFENWRQ